MRPRNRVRGVKATSSAHMSPKQSRTSEPGSNRKCEACPQIGNSMEDYSSNMHVTDKRVVTLDTVKTVLRVNGKETIQTSHVRWQELKEKGLSIEEHKLVFHATMIGISAVLTIIGTLSVFALWHIGMVLPTFPSFVQEVWDWVWKQ